MLKKTVFLVFIIICLIAFLPIVSSAPPITEVNADEGYMVWATMEDYIPTDTDYEWEVHISNKSNGMPIVSGVGVYFHLYDRDGSHLLELYDDTTSHNFDYSFTVAGGNLTRGQHVIKISVNDSTLGGGVEFVFGVNDYGEELTSQIASSHNQSMWFLMILFGLSLVGVFAIPNPLGKLASYFSAHIFFIIGSFSEWQFLQGYATTTVVNAGIFRILFFVSIIALLPAIILSIAMMIVYFSTGKEITRLMDKGMSEAEAYRRTGRKYK